MTVARVRERGGDQEPVPR